MTDKQFRAWLKVKAEGFANRISLLTKSGKPRLSARDLVENAHMIFSEARERLDTISPSYKLPGGSKRKASRRMM